MTIASVAVAMLAPLLLVSVTPISDKTSHTSEKAKPKRLTINITPQLHRELQARADKKGITIAELIRRDVALGTFLDKHHTSDSKLVLETPDQRTVLLVAG